MTEESSIYDRIGGEEGIARLVDCFYERVTSDPELKAYFEHAPMDKLRKMQREFFATATGGPIIYSGRPLRQVHHPLAISRRQSFPRVGQPFGEAIHPDAAIGVQHHLDYSRIFQKPGNRCPECGAQHPRTTRNRLGFLM